MVGYSGNFGILSLP